MVYNDTSFSDPDFTALRKRDQRSDSILSREPSNGLGKRNCAEGSRSFITVHRPFVAAS
jgi:hypothetical protein